MPGRKPHDAYQAFIGPIKDALGCLGTVSLATSKGGMHAPAQRHTVSANRGRGVDLGSGRRLVAALSYEIIVMDEPGPRMYRVSTREYVYALYRDDVALCAWHWHPGGKSPYEAPHLHLESTALSERGMLLSEVHLPTDRITVEQVVRLLLDELGVPPRRADWRECLAASEKRHREHRTWPRPGPQQA